ncbi:MAG: glycosyltransferase family 2 protein, partial [Nitrososphaera sp.]
MEWLFWIGILGVSYSYFIYPLVLLLLPKQSVLRASKNDVELPAVTLIITAHNEARRMQAKLENTLLIDYPQDKLEILVASDASTDETEAIVNSFAGQGVRLVRAEVRKGKEYAQSLAIKEASSDILVFSDVGTEIPKASIRLLVENFADSRVGAVSSEDRFISQDGKIAGEGLYVKYEMWLRGLESAVNSLVGLSGSFFAVRRDLCEDWDITIPSDFNSALNCISRGYIAVADSRVLGFYQDIKDSKKEYQRKVRTVIRGISAVASQPRVLNPLKVGFFAFQVWS